jgi:transglutaminase-like putative cysteine protease
MTRRHYQLLPVLLLIVLGHTEVARAAEPPAPMSRNFLFTYSATITGLPAGRMARVWLPTPSDDSDQTVTLVNQRLPARPHNAQEPKYGNRILFLEAPANAAGEIPLSLTYRVHRRECSVDEPAGPADVEQIKLFLRPDAKVPIGGKPATLVAGKALPADPAALGRYFYDLVDDHMQYRKDKPGYGTGDAEWACDSRFGNCTDFHSLFISLARTSKLPAKFEIGFGIPEKRGAGEVPGYHCWAKFKPGNKSWIPVDISEANKHPEKRDYFFGHLCENRVAFSVGRDLVLVPRQAGPPLNFFVYPYAEVDGQPVPPERIRKQFHYQDVTPGIAK